MELIYHSKPPACQAINAKTKAPCGDKLLYEATLPNIDQPDGRVVYRCLKLSCQTAIVVTNNVKVID